jgi:hypothetical protein
MTRSTYFALTCVVALMFYIAAPVFAQQPSSDTGSSNMQNSTSGSQQNSTGSSTTAGSQNRQGNRSSDRMRSSDTGTSTEQSSSSSTSSTTTQSGKQRSLPRTGSELQLVGLLGALSTTAGYLIRRFGK